MEDPNGDDSGNWSYQLDTSRLDGPVEIVLKGNDAMTRYGIWSPWIHLNIDNPAADTPEVEITHPAESTLQRNKMKINVSAEGKNPIALVELRIDGGDWLQVPLPRTDIHIPWIYVNSLARFTVWRQGQPIHAAIQVIA